MHHEKLHERKHIFLKHIYTHTKKKKKDFLSGHKEDNKVSKHQCKSYKGYSSVILEKIRNQQQKIARKKPYFLKLKFTLPVIVL